MLHTNLLLKFNLQAVRCLRVTNARGESSEFRANCGFMRWWCIFITNTQRHHVEMMPSSDQKCSILRGIVGQSLTGQLYIIGVMRPRVP